MFENYLSAMEEGRYTVAQANAEIDAKGKFVSELVQCRKGGEYILGRPETIEDRIGKASTALDALRRRQTAESGNPAFSSRPAPTFWCARR